MGGVAGDLRKLRQARDRPQVSVAHKGPIIAPAVQFGRRLIRLFEELNGLGTTVVVATHNQTLISQFGYSVLTLVDGTLPPSAGQPAPARSIQ